MTQRMKCKCSGLVVKVLPSLVFMFSFAFCNPSRRICILAFVHSLCTNEKVKYRQCLCFARQTYREEVLEINTNRYSVQIFILT